MAGSVAVTSSLTLLTPPQQGPQREVPKTTSETRRHLPRCCRRCLQGSYSYVVHAHCASSCHSSSRPGGASVTWGGISFTTLHVPLSAVLVCDTGGTARHRRPAPRYRGTRAAPTAAAAAALQVKSYCRWPSLVPSYYRHIPTFYSP